MADDKITKKVRNQVLQEVKEELESQQHKLYNDIYGGRDFTDGAREENSRMITWLNELMK